MAITILYHMLYLYCYICVCILYKYFTYYIPMHIKGCTYTHVYILMFPMKSPVMLETTFKPSLGAHECNLNSWETEAEGSLRALVSLGYKVRSCLKQQQNHSEFFKRMYVCDLFQGATGKVILWPPIYNEYIFSDVYFISKWEVHISFITVFHRAWSRVLQPHPYYRWCQLYTALFETLSSPFPCSPSKRWSHWNLEYIPFFLWLEYTKINIFHGFPMEN